MSVYRTRYPSAHVDTFAQDHLPPLEEWPELRFDLPELQYPPNLNVAGVLVDEALNEGCGGRPALYEGQGRVLTYAQLEETSSRIARVLVEHMGLIPGNRVLLMGPNSIMLATAWLGVLRAGGIVVTVMPLLRAKELAQIAIKARIEHVLCDYRLVQEVRAAAADTGLLSRIITWGQGELEGAMARAVPSFDPVDTASDDVALLAFTSGTTGVPKATMHFHRDVLASADIVGRHLLHVGPDDIHIGTPPLGFTFGLGALLVFPLRFRGAATYVEQPSADALLSAVEERRATALFTSATMYRTLIRLVGQYDISSLRQCISAGEPLPKATSDAWHSATGIRLTDGIGSTEMMHIFVGASGATARPGATGKPLPGYQVAVLDAEGRPQARGSGRLAVRGPTGCRYLDDPRQRSYVVNGWNISGDRYHIDADGYFWFEGRDDDMIISAGYNIAGPEVESALLAHPLVRECAVVASPDAERGHVVKAFVVVESGAVAGPQLVEELQLFVKKTIAPYKYPRRIEFVESLPKTATGKILRRALRAVEQRIAIADDGNSAAR